jgi:hypothetical protein
LQIVARAALSPGFPSPAVDLRRIARPKRLLHRSKFVRWSGPIEPATPAEPTCVTLLSSHSILGAVGMRAIHTAIFITDGLRTRNRPHARENFRKTPT